MSGEEEQKHPMEMNLFIDQIIKTVLEHGHDRNIVFSSFNPDACTMLVLGVIYNSHGCYYLLMMMSEDNLDDHAGFVWGDFSLKIVNIYFNFRVNLKQNKYPVLILTQVSVAIFVLFEARIKFV